MNEQDKLNLVTNYFAEDWAIEKAMQLLEDYESSIHSVMEDAMRYRWLRINAIGAFCTNGGKGPVSVYHLSKIPAIPGIPEETDAAIDVAMQERNFA